MATPAPAVQPGDVWGQALLDHINSKHTDTANAAAADAQAKATAAQNAAKTYADNKAIVLGPQDPVPANTPAGTIFWRTT